MYTCVALAPALVPFCTPSHIKVLAPKGSDGQNETQHTHTRTQHTNSAVPSKKKGCTADADAIQHQLTYLAAGRLSLLASAELEQVAQAQGKSRSGQKQGQRATGRDPFQHRATRFGPARLHRAFSRGGRAARLSQGGIQRHSGGGRRGWADLCPSDEDSTAANRWAREDGVTTGGLVRVGAARARAIVRLESAGGDFWK